ncbi:hypothetical protein [Methylobacter sp. S3L5C]|uniref:hypothetical protein n=1 Tax=Methylobacter sp. S3L5C TaxID=2839024 RepID=UPI001FAD1FD7|nr:hypothetical protein [Methylobacter sp. S3L5C]UOA08123.1 hypothetical protein KKZ03_18170 [Methylobacter sp. S3L5C]
MNTTTELSTISDQKSVIPTQKWNRVEKRRSRKRKELKACMPEAARATLFDMKRDIVNPDSLSVSKAYTVNATNQSHYKETNIKVFKHCFFKENQPEYPRLPSLHKLFVAQFMLNNALPETIDDALEQPISIPFVLRYSLEQQGQTQRQINKKICRVLGSVDVSPQP